MLVNSADAGSIVWSMGVGPQISTSIPHLEGDQASFVLADWFFKFCLASSIATCVHIACPVGPGPNGKQVLPPNESSRRSYSCIANS